MNLPTWIQIIPFTGDKSKGYWRITDAVYEDPGNTNVYAFAFNADGTPSLNSQAVQKNGGTTSLPFHTNSQGQAEASFNMTGDSSFDPNKGQRGPYSLAMFGQSDVASGMGLPLRQHVSVRFTFQWTVGPTPPPPPPPPGDYVTHAEFEGLLHATLKKWLESGAF